MTESPSVPGPPKRLRELVSWQSARVSTLGARLTAGRMPLPARAEFAVLATLDEYGSLSQADLGRHLLLDRNDVNGIVDRLQSDGAIDRRPDPADRRRNVVTITAAGRSALATLQDHAVAVQGELLRGLDDPERRQLVALLAKLLAAHGPQSA